MTPLNSQRRVWAPLAVVMFAWLVAGIVLSQEKHAAGRAAPSAQAPASTIKARPASVADAPPAPRKPAASQPVSRPGSELRKHASTYPATQEARQRLSRLNALKQAATQQTTRPGNAARKPARTPPHRLTRAEREKRLEEARARRKAAMQRALARRREQASRPGATSRPLVTKHRPASRPAMTRKSTSPTGKTGTQVKVAPPPKRADGRDYFIAFDGMPWEDVITFYADLVGKPLMPTDVMLSGELTYHSKRRFTKQEMLDELNFLLIDQDAYVVETPDYIYLIPLSEIDKYLPLDRYYDSVAAFQKAHLRDLEFCEVLIQIKDRSAKDIRDMLSPSMPDYALPVVVGDTNKIKITGLARDVRRFLDLLSIVKAEKYDPRTTKFIKVETNVREIERMVREVFNVNQAQRRYNRETKKFETVGGGSNIIIIPDERTKNLIVKATPEDLKRIEEFVRKIDQKPDIGEFKTTVIPVQYGSATDIATLLNEIIQQEQGRRSRLPIRSTRSRSVRGRKPTRTTTRSPAPEDIIVEDLYERAKKTVRIVADSRTNTLIVYANDDGLKRVREILKQVDQPVPANFKTFALHHARAEEIQPTLEQITRSITGAGGRRGARGASIIADPGTNAIHVLADRENMTRIEQIIHDLDVPGAEDHWHFVELKNITASQAAGMIAPMLRTAGAPTARFSRSRRGGRAAATSTTIPLDEANTLIVICSDAEWDKVEKILKIADENAVSIRPEIRFFPIEHGNVQGIATTIRQLYGNYQHPVLGRSRTFVDVMGDKLVVQGVRPALDEIASLVKSLDVPPAENPLVIIPLEYADATQLVQYASSLLPPGTRVGRRGRGAAGPGATLTADPVTNSLIVQADKLTVQRIKDFARDMETKVAAQKPQRRYYTLKNAAPRDVLSAINSLFSGSGGYRRGRNPVGTQVKTVIVGNQVVVDAPADKQREIEALVQQLDDLSDKGITTLLVKMPGADVRAIARKLNDAFRERVRRQGVTAQFSDDASTETILVTVSKDVADEANRLLEEYKEASAGLVNQTTFYQLQNANASEVASWLRNELVTLMTKKFGRAAAQQVRVTADTRTNRIIISAPQVAVQAAEPLLKQYDVPQKELANVSPMVTETRKLPGLDVANLANQLNRAWRERDRSRADKLRTTFGYDRLTEMLIVTTPKDTMQEIDELIAKFVAETEGMTPEQKFIEIKNADANYIANQMRNILNVRISSRRGRDIANRVNIQVDSRLNRVILNAPKFAIEMAEALVKELDQPPTAESQLQTIPLANADANTVYGILRTIFNEKIRARTLSISVEPLTNSLIVGATKEDFEDIKQWAENLDAKATEAVSAPVIIELKNANPWDVYRVLQTTFVRKGYGRRQPPGKEIKIEIVAGRSLVVQAPSDKLKEIKELAAKLDKIGQNSLVVRTYKLPGLGTQLNSFARQIQNAVNSQVKAREQRVSITALPAADTLIVTAAEQQLPSVEKAMDQFRGIYKPQRMETITLLNADANAVYQAVSRVLQQKIRAGKIQLSVEGMTNSLIVSANDEDMKDLKDWVQKFDQAAAEAIVPPRIFELKNANPWEVRSVLNTTFLQGGAARRRRGMEIRFDVVGGRSVLVRAPADKMKQIEDLIKRLDEMVSNKAEVRTFKVAGMGTKLSDFARQIERSVNSQVQARDRRISVAAYPPADVLIVTAQRDQFDMIAKAMDEFRGIFKPGRIETISLKNGDANAVYNALRSVLQPKMRAGKIQISVEGLTNSLIVMANDEDMNELKAWVKKFDQAAAESVSPPRIFELKNANPWEVRNVLNTTFLSGGRGRRQGGKEVRFDVIGGRSVVVMAPADKMKDIEKLIHQLDEVGANKAEVRTYELAGLGSRINEFARQLQTALDRQRSGREQRISITAYPPADALIVAARSDQFEQVEQMMEQLRPLMQVAKSKTEFFELKYVDANQIVNLVRDLVQKRSQARGKRGSQDFSVSADPRTNRLIVFAPESILPDVREVVKELDVEVEDTGVTTIELKYADPWETRNVINDMFGNRGSRRGQSQTEQVYVTVSNNTLIVKAPPKKLEQVKKFVAQIDAPNPNELQIKLYELKVLNAQDVSRQVQMFLAGIGGNYRRGEMRPGAFAEPTTNTLVVMAPADKLPFIDTLISQIESRTPETAVSREYLLKNARADQVRQHVEQMLRVKVAEKEGAVRGRRTQQLTAVMADSDTNRLFVFAPEEYQELAAELIKMVDEQVNTGEIVHIIRLENADAASLAQTVTQTMQGNGPRGRAAAARVKVVPDAGSNSIVLSGLPQDVADVEKIIKDLEVKYDTVPELHYFDLNYAMASEVADVLSNMFPAGRAQGNAVTITPDEYYNRVLVTANQRIMRQVEAVVAQLDQAPKEGEGLGLAGGKDIYFVEVYRGDPFEIAMDVSDLLPPAEQGGPTVDADLFGDYIKVVCRPAEYPRIERLIQQFDRRAKPKIVIRARKFNGDQQRLLQYLQARQLEFQVVQPPQKLKQNESIIIDLHPEEDQQSRTPRARSQAPAPGAPAGWGGVVLAAVFGDEPPASAPVGNAPDDSSAQPAPVHVTAPPASKPPAAATPPKQPEESALKRMRTTVQMLPDGRVLIRGPEDAVNDIEDAIDLFEEDLSRGEVIRIFHFRHGDVNAASRILDMMFNTRQVRMPQQRPQTKKNGGKRGAKAGAKGQQDMMAQIQQMIGGRTQAGGKTARGTQIRIATDASHSYLIVKCDEALLPDIIQLLRELDIPPANVDVEVIQLKNLDASETAANIKDVLGISKSRTTTRAPKGRSPQQQLMQMLQQQMVSVGGHASAKVESVEIVPNTITNSLLVSAPPDVMDIIKTVITDMENLEGGDVVVIKHVALKKARVEDVLPLLQEIFTAAGGNARGGRRGGSPANLGPVTISADPRTNAIIFVAQAKDVDTVRAQIESLDIAGAIADVEMYVCKYGDAAAIAQAVGEMFAGTSPRRSGRRSPRGAAAGTPNIDLRITAEPGTNTILVRGPAERRDEVFKQIEKLDRQSRYEIHELQLAFAKPQQVADKLIQIFGGSGGSALGGRAMGGRRRGRSAVAQVPGRIVVVGDDNTKRLFIRAPDEIYDEMENLVSLLDQPSEKLQVKRFALKHADASAVVESVKGAMMEYMQLQRQLGGSEMNFDAFTAVADPRTNSVIVVGSKETFVFVDQIINEVDGAIPAEQQKQFRMFVLDNADAQTVADAINSFAAGGATTGGRRGGRRGRGMMAGAMSAGTLDVQAVAEPASNAVMVYGRPDDVALVEQKFIRELEGAVSAHLQFATIPVKEAVPSELISYIQPFIDQTAGMGETRGGRGRGARGTAANPGPRLIGNDNVGTIVVYGSQTQIDQVRMLVQRFDNKDTRFNQHEIIPIPWGQDAAALASLVQDLVNNSEQEIAARTGREPRLVTVSADEHSNAIIAFGDPAQTALVKTVVSQLQEIRPEKPVTRIIELVNLSSDEAQALIEDMQQRRAPGAGRSSSFRRSPSRSRGSSFRRSPSRSRRSGSRRPSSGRRSRPRRRSRNIDLSPAGPRLAGIDNGPRWPLIGTSELRPTIITLLLRDDPNNVPATEPNDSSSDDETHTTDNGKAAPPASEANEPVRANQPAPSPDGPRQPADNPALRAARAQPPAHGSRPATPPPLNSISGQLRGEVIATPIDSKRIIITGDQDDVDFIVQMLALMERSTPKPTIEVFTLQNTKAAAIAPVLEQTMQALIQTRGGGDRVDNFSIVAEARSNSLIVSASETNMEMIAEIVARLDIDTLKDTQVKIVPLKHMRAAEAFDLLQDAIKKLNDMRDVPANSQATIQAIERSNAIQIVGTASDIKEIERMIEGIDVELPPEDDFTTADIFVYDLKNANAEDLAKTLTDMIKAERVTGTDKSKMPMLRKLFVRTADGRELPPLNLDKPILILPEKGKNSLLIFSNKPNGEALLEIVKLFDQLPTGEEIEVKSFALKHANADELAQLLQKMFDDAKASLKRATNLSSKSAEKGVMLPSPPGIAARGLPYNIVITADVRSNTLMVVGHKDSVLLAAGLVSQLDKPSTNLGIKPHLLQLRNVQATTLKDQLDQMLKDRLDALGDSKNTARDSAIITADDRSNTLVVLATDSVFKMVEDLATRLDGASPYSVVDSEFRRLQFADAAKLAGMLQELFDKKKDADRDVTQSGQKNVLYVFADARSNSLMLTGTRDYLQEAKALIDKLDQSYDPTVQFRVRPVRLNSAANIAQLLGDMIKESRSDQKAEMKGTPIYVGADPYSNNLLLAASQEDMRMLERWIDLLDRPAEPGRIIRIIPLKHGRAQDLAQNAQNLFQTKASGADADVTVTYEETTNSVIAIGPPAVVKDIVAFVNDLNTAEGAGAIVKIFKLKQADVADAGELLRNILEGRGGAVGGGRTSGSTRSQQQMQQVVLMFQRQHPEIGPELLKALRSDIVVTDDLRTNSLVVTAPPESMPLMESLVKAIDVPPESANIRVFRLRNADAQEMVTTLEGLFANQQQGGSSNTNANEQEMRLTLGDLVPGGRQQIAFTVDTRTNSVIAAGTLGYLDMVDELILKLDSQPIRERKTLVVQPANNPASAIQQAIKEYNDAEQQRLSELGEDISVTKKQEREIVAIANEDTNRLILDYDPRRESDILQLVRDLDQPPPQVMIQVLIVEVTIDNSLDLGVEFAFQDLQYTKAGPTDTTTFDFVGGTDIGAAGTGLGGFTFTITGADFNFLLRTLQNEGHLNVLSRPQIVAMDNQEASIKITNDVPYLSGSTVTATGIVQSNVARREVGIELTVTPHINPDGFVRMEIDQKVSDITGSTVDVGNGATSPVFLDREATTTVTVKDNETVVLGGLITTRDERREQKVPLLGDIPLLGWLARNDHNETKHTELLVILTPRVVRSVEDYRELSAQERDRTGVIPESVLTSELMSGLQVKPENVTTNKTRDLIGPFPEKDESQKTTGSGQGAYGPRPPAKKDGSVGETYDIPISWTHTRKK